MDKKYQTAPCGLDCFNCGWFEEHVTDDFRQKEAKRLGILPSEVGCKGCRGENGKCYWAKGDCATWACVEKKGLTYCFECGEFPCGLLAPSAIGADYPHNMKVYNLCRMKLNGIDAWIGEAADIRKRYYTGEFIVGKGPVVKDE